MIVKPQNDKRLYKSIVLGNDLQCLLVHDAETEKAAASLDVRVGHFSDPHGVHGLAHFCEHMLFLGTEKYPEENTYSEYLNEHGGSSNAYTSKENTNYYFDVAYTHLEGALDRFAQFFISPLFTQDCTDREMKAVHSEHCKNLQNDTWRTMQLQHSTANPDHVYFKFGTGNSDTLNIPEIRDKLLEFHSKYYSSNLMKLAVIGRESLEELEKLVNEKFSSVVNKKVPVPSFSGDVFLKDQLKIKQFVVPVKDIRKLYITFPIPPQEQLWRGKPSHIVSHLIGHEGEGSILSHLKSKAWGTELTAGAMDDSSQYALFGVIINLTADGLLHVDEIIDIVFQYIKLLKTKGIQKWIFDELKSISEIKFRFKDTIDPYSYAPKLTSDMHLYPVDHLLTGSDIEFDWEPELIQQVLNALTPDNCRFTIFSKSYDGKTDKVEKWYGIHYFEEPVPENLLAKWRDPELTAGLNLPQPNPFIADDFSSRCPEVPQSDALVPPTQYTTNTAMLWYKYDAKFLIPKAYQIISFINPFNYSSPRNVVLTTIYVSLVEDLLNEFSYDALLAGLTFNLSNTNEGFTLQLKGYNCKQPVLLRKILEKLKNLHSTQDRFEVIREKLQRSYDNNKFDPPYQIASYRALLCIDQPRWSIDDYLKESIDVTLDELEKFVPKLLEELYYECLIIGNVSKQDADDSIKLLHDIIGAKPLPKDKFKKKQLVKLADGKSYLHRVSSQNPKEVNSSINYYCQVGLSDIKTEAVASLFAACSSTSSFNQLRTVEQLGYIVWSGQYESNGVTGFRVIVQSSEKDPVYLEQRIESWITQFKGELEKMTDEEFQNFKASLIIQKLQKDKSLKEEVARWKIEINPPRPHKFNRSQEEAEEIEKLTREELMDFYLTFIALPSESGRNTRRMFSTHVYGSQYTLPEKSTIPQDVVVIDDIYQWRDSMECYPMLYELPQDIPFS
eukprot:TRINITY_DN4988_c0_g1_i1.p1 TRINITY_DN4988_c0_g1~~TRINITY_DN4988_c0_g1_i1.p1  ORF type:complete len:953 (-),score=186.42 TRINITY_DN4988_c0_g1_i1:40-2898(-)